MEGLDEMRDSESIGGRFVQRKYVTEEAQAVIDRISGEQKERKKAMKEKLKAEQLARQAKELVPA